MNAVRSNNVSLKYQRFTSSGCEDIRITKIDLWQRLNSFNRSKTYPARFHKECGLVWFSSLLDRYQQTSQIYKSRKIKM